MKQFIIIIFCVISLVSCITNRKIEKNTYYMWENKIVTKKQYDSLLENHTNQFIREYFLKMDSLQKVNSDTLNN